jgi:hypothetical protein
MPYMKRIFVEPDSRGGFTEGTRTHLITGTEAGEKPELA